MEDYTLDKLDHKILKLISNDARISFLEVARICNVSGAAVHQRIQKMIVHGFITGSQFIINLKKIGYSSCAYLLLKVDRGEDATRVVEKLKAIDEIAECHQTIGSHDLFIKLYAINNEHLLNIVEDKIKKLPISECQTIISYNELLQRQITFSAIDK